MKALIQYLERLQCTQGQGAGSKLQLHPWQRRFIRGAFRPTVQEAALTVARGNGKSTLLAGVAAAAVDPNGPLHRPRGETICVASSLQQSKIIFGHCKAFLEASGYKLSVANGWKIADSVNHAQLLHRATGSLIRCVGSDPRRLHGLAPFLQLLDEPAQWPHTRANAMVAAIRTGRGKQPQSLMVTLGTKSHDPQHFFSKMLAGGADYIQDHSVPADADHKLLGRVRTWVKANPGLPFMPHLRQAIASDWKRTEGDPQALASFMALRLNMGLEDTESKVLVSARDWMEAEGDVPAEGPRVMGLDLGSTRGLSAVSAYWPVTGRLQAIASFPRLPAVAERERRDGVGDGTYRTMLARGELHLMGSRVSDPEQLMGLALELWGEPQGIATDRFRQGELMQALDNLGWHPPIDCRSRMPSQNAEDVRGFIKLFHGGQVHPVESLLMRFSMSEARTKTDAYANRFLEKAHHAAKDDVAVSTVYAVGAAARHPELSEPPVSRPKVVVI